MVNLSDAAPQPPESYSSGSGDPIEPAPVVFLFKYKELYSHNVSYDWVVSACVDLVACGYQSYMYKSLNWPKVWCGR